jgi:Kelch motif
MAKALPAGRAARRRPMFGLFDGDGWAWATTKAFFWLLVLIMTLGYIPDRAYYFMVSRTIELGILGWSPVNLCPPENGTEMPCPVPAGGVLPWQASPREAALPQSRSGGAAIQLGTNLLYAGGTDGTAPSATSFQATLDNGSFGGWAEGPALPEARTNAALAVLSGTAYLVGGTGPDGAPTTTVWAIGLDPDTSELTEWTTEVVEDTPLPELPAPRAGASAVAVSDGIVVIGGRGPDNQPTTTVWKATLDDEGALGKFVEQAALQRPVTDASAAFEGAFIWVYGGSDAAGATASVQRAGYGTAPTDGGDHGAAPEPSPSASAEEALTPWAVRDESNLPAPRTGAAGFAANGAIYLVGGSDGTTAQRELYWALPDSEGNLPGGWRHLDPTDLPTGIVDAAAVVTGSTAILLGGTSDGGALATSTRTSLAPGAPFFRLGIAGVVVPALQIPGEIGQQIGYLAAAGVGTGNFVILVIVGWAFNHRPEISAWRERRRLAKEARAPKSPVG